MAAILNGFLPLRRKEQYAQERVLNTRWGDASISAPIHGGWAATSTSATQIQSSPDWDRDLPPTPPQTHDDRDGVYIVHDEEDHHTSEDETTAMDRDHMTIKIPLPWKKKKKVSSHARSNSINSIINSRYTSARCIDLMPPPLATAEAAAIPLPESRISSPVCRATTTSPVLSFRTRLASPNLGDMLSPVSEGFAKTGPSSRSTPVLSPLQFAQAPPLDRPPTASSMRSNLARRPSLSSHHNEGIGAGTMSSQGMSEDQTPDFQRPPSRGIGSTAHMRASSRGPRPASRGPRSPSVEPSNQLAETSFTKPDISEVQDMQPVRRRAPSVEAFNRRAPSVEPTAGRAPSVGPSITRRAASREPRGRRGASVEPRARTRFHSEAPRKAYRRDSSSSNDGPASSGDEKADSSEPESFFEGSRFKRDFNSTRRPRRRRSIASPISSPTAAVFGVSQTAAPPCPPTLNTNLDSICTSVELPHSVATPPIAQRSAPRNRSKSRTRGLYADMHDDFRLLARDVHKDASSSNAITSPVAPSPVITQLPRSVLSPGSLRAPSPALASNPAAFAPEPERTGYSSDSSIPTLTSTTGQSFERQTDTSGGKALLAALARDRKDQLRREERERTREKSARKLERDIERQLALNAISDCESVTSGFMSGGEKTRRAYGGSINGDTDHPGRKNSMEISGKTLVPNAEEIWG